jgi:accessory gene regulator protein AgrB
MTAIDELISTRKSEEEFLEFIGSGVGRKLSVSIHDFMKMILLLPIAILCNVLLRSVGLLLTGLSSMLFTKRLAKALEKHSIYGQIVSMLFLPLSFLAIALAYLHHVLDGLWEATTARRYWPASIHRFLKHLAPVRPKR